MYQYISGVSAQATSTPLVNRGSNQGGRRRKLCYSTRTRNAPASTANALRGGPIYQPNMRLLLESDSDFEIYGANRTQLVQADCPPCKKSAWAKVRSSCPDWTKYLTWINCTLRCLRAIAKTLILVASGPLWLVALYIVAVEYVFTHNGRKSVKYGQN